MDRLKAFLKDHMGVTLLFALAATGVIGFYLLTTSGVFVIYPICVVVFFYVVYMIIAWVKYCAHSRNLDRLSQNAVCAKAFKCEHEKVYNTMNALHSEYNNRIAKLEEKNREDKRFISGYIHNLKTPITVSSIIVQRGRAGEIKPMDAIDALETELSRLNGGLNMLLDLQRIDELEKDYEPERINLTEEVRVAINNNRSLFINSGVFPLFESENVYVFTDKKWNQVLINQILSNAVKYSKGEENKHVYFDIQQMNAQSDGQHKVILTIKDEGIGISEYDLPRVFQPFFTGENGRKGYNSSGIGLYLCKTICDRLGQEITIENDNGCKVTIQYNA